MEIWTDDFWDAFNITDLQLYLFINNLKTSLLKFGQISVKC